MFSFAWDPIKADGNWRKHGVTFEEASSVFLDALAVTFDDPASSYNEKRERTYGMSAMNRLLVVCSTERGNVIRLISARKATRHEAKIYQEG